MGKIQRHDPDIVICADWSKVASKRAVYLADKATRSVRRASGTNWSLAKLLQLASKTREGRKALVSVDLPLGVPASYLKAAHFVQIWKSFKNFADWLPQACMTKSYFNPVISSKQWSVSTPFFKVPKGKGSLNRFIDAAKSLNVSLRRRIEIVTQGKSVFSIGLPGHVAPAAQSFWQELGPTLASPRAFKIWPFEGSLDELFSSTDVILGEIYPRAAYSTALANSLPSQSLTISKTKPVSRRQAIDHLRNSDWVRQCKVTLHDLDEAIDNEDDFDALMTAAALLRCILTSQPLSSPVYDDQVSEGGILCSGTLIF